MTSSIWYCRCVILSLIFTLNWAGLPAVFWPALQQEVHLHNLNLFFFFLEVSSFLPFIFLPSTSSSPTPTGCGWASTKLVKDCGDVPWKLYTRPKSFFASLQRELRWPIAIWFSSRRMIHLYIVLWCHNLQLELLCSMEPHRHAGKHVSILCSVKRRF